MAKRITAIYVDEPHERLNNMISWNGVYRKFSTPNERGSHILADEHIITQKTWEKLGKPHKMKITITATDDD